MARTVLAEQIRAARRQHGLTQAGLAERSEVSRVTIARLESGAPQDLRARTLARLCEALGLEMAALPLGGQPRLEKRLAREKDRTRRVERRRDHAVLAARLLAAPRPEARQLIARAQGVVDRWGRDRLCSQHYISRWRALLAGPVERVARALIEPSDWTDALFQNTPWSFALPGTRP
ncbi:MAG: helix-turn-helix domain-containing protein [Acidobacteria bacterium]|nr:helix-turn-helix domain-containing protein [Acidobacteriota bacterium]